MRLLMRICELGGRKKQKKEKFKAKIIHKVYTLPSHFIKVIKLVR
jgi:hypothetical protein